MILIGPSPHIYSFAKLDHKPLEFVNEGGGDIGKSPSLDCVWDWSDMGTTIPASYFIRKKDVFPEGSS